ncbi:MAG: RNA polymerase sigma factor (sigma-70 family) [Crocinitomicaceae bacterium]|jgi:RNA polymerase sigma factor (sigma-70 family)
MKSDVQLVHDLKNKGLDAMGDLYARYFDRVYQKCLSITKNESDAYDCTNDALLLSFEKIDSFKENSSYSTWLFAITTNYCISFYRKRRKGEDLGRPLKNAYCLPKEYELTPQKDLCEILEELLNIITISEKELLLDKYSYRRSIEELQEKYGMGASAIKMRLSRAKQKVQNLYYSNLAMSA